MRLKPFLTLLLMVLSASAATAAEPWTLDGRVVRVHDGDTLTLLDAQNRQHQIRLDGIDAPELGQAFGKASRKSLQEISLRQNAQASCHKQDRYGRAVCRVTVNGADTSQFQLDTGMAWVFRRYERELAAPIRQAYDLSERQARQQRRGLWSEPSPEAPWDWRAAHAPKAAVRAD